MTFPITRLRRLRRNATMRRMVRETVLSVDDLILPLFVRPGEGVKNEISSMPGNYQWSVDTLVEECKEIEGLGIPAVILFGIPEQKDAEGSEAYADDGIVCRAIEAIKGACNELVVITDVCMCEYTDHGHCGVIMDNRDGNPDVDNDATLELLVREALAHVNAGADMVAPSDMMDGRVGEIRLALDDEGFSDVPIMAYSAKFSSGFYGPFREAAESPPQFGDRSSYQMDPANLNEAIREIELDIEEGADIVMVKPALPYLDVIRRAADDFDLPIAAYNVSGEFAMLKAAAANGWLDEKRVAMESLLSIKRAGAKLILTYWAKDAAKWLAE
ncbi:MAG: porphobilinogen synthase [Candidatus Hydrogenedentes bacterium]|nr:porphobilinogen synthase [Candidatus Hydrogenedentota bacterium]